MILSLEYCTVKVSVFCLGLICLKLLFVNFSPRFDVAPAGQSLESASFEVIVDPLRLMAKCGVKFRPGHVELHRLNIDEMPT